MSRQTTNYGLTKPDYTDIADIEVVNSNMDIIDEALKVIDTKAQNVMSKNSSAWSSTTTYTVGQYCIYNNSLWKCLVQHSGQTPQEGTYWTKVSLDTLGAEISAINQNLDKIEHIQFDSITDSTGDASFPHHYEYVNGYVVIGAQVTNANYLCTPFHGSTPNYVHITDIQGNTIVDTSVHIYATLVKGEAFKNV